MGRWLRPLAMAGAAVPGLAAAVEGPYFGIEAGPSWAMGENARQNGAGIGTLHFGTGYSGGLVWGYALPLGLRPELELNYRRNDLKDATGFGLGGPVGAGGFNDTYTAMANLWYGFSAPSGLFSKVHPYFGGGAGGALVSLHHPSVGGMQFNNAHNYTLAYQGGAGVEFDVAPDVTVSADWRYLQTNRNGYDLGVAGGDTDLRYRAQTAMIGLKIGLGATTPPPPPPPPQLAEAPPPPPPPPPAPVCNPPPGFQVDANCNIIQQTLVVRQVDFKFNSDQLTAPAQATLDGIAAALAQQPSLAVEINGYTDNVGSAAYNLKLSQRRAESVRSYLASKGVNPANLGAHGLGKDNPIASNESAEGRAQNRRVEFAIRNAPANVKVEQQGATPESTQAAQQDGRGTGHAKHHARHHHVAPPAGDQPQ
ncbi:MAG: OmpA family protein [Nevskia sp.]|nr:OmpA family protein [Nevskia sp.]